MAILVAEIFINIAELRFSLYREISNDANGDFSSYTGFLMSSPLINAEATAEMVKIRRELVSPTSLAPLFALLSLTCSRI